jgi:hypothetical protein
MLLLEAARQAACAVTPAGAFVAASVDVAFHRYAEIDRPCWITAGALCAEPGGNRTVRVCGHQDNELVFLATLGCAAPGGSGEWGSC